MHALTWYPNDTRVTNMLPYENVVGIIIHNPQNQQNKHWIVGRSDLFIHSSKIISDDISLDITHNWNR